MSNKTNRSEEKEGVWGKLLFCIFFALIFWAAFYYLSMVLGFSENIALIAVIVGIVPMPLFFTPMFQRLAQRISSVKVGGVEFDLTETLSSKTNDHATVLIEPGKQELMMKGGVESLSSSISKHLPNQRTRFILSIDLRQGDRIPVPMVFFQARLLHELFDLRAILFINSGYTEIEERIVGTIKPVRFLKRLNEYSYKSNNGNKQVLENTYKSDKGNEQGLEEIFNSLFYKYIDTLATNEVTYFVERLWKRFSQEMLPDFKSMYCSEGTFRMILGDLLERNVIYQSDIDNSKLLSYLDSDFHNIIFIQENGRIFVRTIDNIARDLSKRVIFPSLGNDDL